MRISSKMVSASGSGTSDALWESYHARSYLHFKISGCLFVLSGGSVTHLVITENLADEIGEGVMEPTTSVPTS